MRYTVNYCGAFYINDSDKFNIHEFDCFKDAYDLLMDLIHCGVDENAYIKDEEYECCFRWDKKHNEFYWD